MDKFRTIILSATFCALCGGGAAARDPALVQRLERHVYTLADDSMAGRKAGSAESASAAEYIIGQFCEIGVEPYNGTDYMQPFVPDMLIGPSKKTCNNIIGIIKGNTSGLSGEYIVIGAHYDHLGTVAKGGGKGAVYNGADDNASGVAALIELARGLYAIRGELKRSVILVAFDAEESGLLGSRHFVTEPIVPLDDMKLMMSVDMVGWLQKSGSLYYYGTGTVRNGRAALTGIVPPGLDIVARRYESSLRTSTDTEPFAIRDIPTLLVTTGRKSPYHKPEDDPELIDYAGMALITAHLTEVVKLFSTDEEMEATGQRSFKHRDYDRRFEIGITLVGGSNSLRYSSGTYRGKTAPSFGVGLYTQVNMGYLGFRPEVLYERNGAQHPDGRLWTNSVTVPVSLVLQTPKSLVGGFYLNAGGYYRYAFSGTQGGEKMDFTNMFERHEGGVQWGLGMWLYHISVGVNFRYGLTDLLREAGDRPNIRNRSTQLTVSYIF